MAGVVFLLVVVVDMIFLFLVVVVADVMYNLVYTQIY